MITAFVLLEAERTALPRLGDRLREIDGVAEVYSVTGAWDFVAIVRVDRHEQLAAVLTDRVSVLEGISRSQTMVAFDGFSDYNLDEIFSDEA